MTCGNQHECLLVIKKKIAIKIIIPDKRASVLPVEDICWRRWRTELCYSRWWGSVQTEGLTERSGRDRGTEPAASWPKLHTPAFNTDQLLTDHMMCTEMLKSMYLLYIYIYTLIKQGILILFIFCTCNIYIYKQTWKIYSYVTFRQIKYRFKKYIKITKI